MTEGLNETTVASRVDISWHQEFLFSFIKREKVFPSIILETTMLLLAFFLKSDKKIGVSGYPSTFLGYMYLKVAQLCPTLCYPMDCSPTGPSVQGIFQARLLEWIAISFSRGSSKPRDRTWVSCIAGTLFTVWATRKAQSRILKYAFFHTVHFHSNLRYADNNTLMAESEEELKRLLMKVKDESEKAGLKLNIQ